MPLLSPIYGDITNLPPTLLFSGTRDLFLSNTVRMHLKLRDTGVNANLIVFEGLSHAQYLMVPDAPETKRYFMESQNFFDQYLAK
ncbi:alpha/beta hydrolase [Orbus mooreae]